jgi:SAM-dependent methyltransferase
MPKFTYLLGYDRGEAARLRAQARLWDPISHALFERTGVAPHWKVLEIGPGQGSLHLDLRRRVRGPIDAVERSAPVARRLEQLTRRDRFGQGRIWVSDLIDADLPARTYDLIFARWVFLFLPRPDTHVAKLARALKPGGILAVQDYHRETLMLVPQPKEWPDFMAADRAFFASQGGHASIGTLLPDLYRRAGLTVIETHHTVKSGRPGTPVWNWLTTYFLGVMNRYGMFPPFSPASARHLSRAWRAAGHDTTSLLIGPALLDVIGRKRRS